MGKVCQQAPRKEKIPDQRWFSFDGVRNKTGLGRCLRRVHKTRMDETSGLCSMQLRSLFFFVKKVRRVVSIMSFKRQEQRKKVSEKRKEECTTHRVTMKGSSRCTVCYYKRRREHPHESANESKELSTGTRKGCKGCNAWVCKDCWEMFERKKKQTCKHKTIIIE